MEQTADCTDIVEIGGLRFCRMIEGLVIRETILGMASRLQSEYRDRRPLMVGVLNGAAIFHSDLIRAMEIPLTVDFLRISSYGDGIASSGTLTFSADCSTQIAGRNVIVVEDIVDTGRTVEHLRGLMLERGAESVAVATLLYKREADLIGRRPEYVAFEIPNRFVVGFGLDYAQEGRNLRHLYVLQEA